MNESFLRMLALAEVLVWIGLILYLITRVVRESRGPAGGSRQPVLWLGLIMVFLMFLAVRLGELFKPAADEARGRIAGMVKAQMLDGAGRHADAAAEYRRLIDRLPDPIRPEPRDGVETEPVADFNTIALYHNYGKALLLSGDAEGSLRAYTTMERAMEQAVGLANYSKGSALIRLGRFAEAMTEFDAAIERDPTIYDAHQNRCATFRLMERYEDSIAACLATLERFPSSPKTYMSLGRAYQLAGRIDEARSAYQQARRLSPGWNGPLMMLNELDGQQAAGR